VHECTFKGVKSQLIRTSWIRQTHLWTQEFRGHKIGRTHNQYTNAPCLVSSLLVMQTIDHVCVCAALTGVPVGWMASWRVICCCFTSSRRDTACDNNHFVHAAAATAAQLIIPRVHSLAGRSDAAIQSLSLSLCMALAPIQRR
jgi:hypothetical protein